MTNEMQIWHVSDGDYWAIISAPDSEMAITRYVAWVSEPEEGRDAVTATLCSEKATDRIVDVEMTVAEYAEWSQRRMPEEPTLLAVCEALQ